MLPKVPFRIVVMALRSTRPVVRCATPLVSAAGPLGRALLALALTALPVDAGEVFAKPPSATGGLNASAMVWPDGSDSDMFAWDDFTLAATQVITEVRWRGGYSLNAAYGKASDFRVSFFDSIAGGFQPVITALPEHESQETVIATFHTDSNAFETFVGTFGGKAMYDYRFTLPEPVTLQGGVKYWFRVVAMQPIYPDWGMATSTFGNHFKYNQGAHMFQNWPNELSFSLRARWEYLGSGLAGTTGVPALVGEGTLAGGAAAALLLSNARPSSAAWVVAGLTQIDAPFKGGVLVPEPELVIGLATDAAGALTVPFAMPVGVPPGVDIIAQMWIADPLAVHGLAASNGVLGTTP